MFQFTLPRGERPPAPVEPVAVTRSFNSRSRVGSDPAKSPPPSPASVSIHAPAWGATRQAHRGRQADAGFNSRSRVGSDKDISKKLED